MGKIANLVAAFAAPGKLEIELDEKTMSDNFVAGVNQNGRPVVMSTKNVANAFEAGIIKDADKLELDEDQYFKDRDRSTEDYDVIFIRLNEDATQTDMKAALSGLKKK